MTSSTVAGIDLMERQALIEGKWNVWPMSTRMIELGFAKRSTERHFMIELTPEGLRARASLIEEERS